MPTNEAFLSGISTLETGSVTPNAQPSQGGIKFIWEVHSIEHVSRVLKELEGCDIVAMETVGRKNAEDRQESADYGMAVIAADAPADLVARLRAREDFNSSTKLLSGLVGSAKIISLLDIDRDHAEYGLVDRFDQATESADELIEAGAPLTVIRQSLFEQAKTLAESCKVREPISARQLRELRRQYPDKKIGAVMGIIHTGVRHILEREGERTESVFVDSEQPDANEHGYYEYRYLNRVARILRFDTNKDKDHIPGLLDRATLYHATGLSLESIIAMDDDEVQEQLQVSAK